MNTDNFHSTNSDSTHRRQTARMNSSRNTDILILHSSSSDCHSNTEYRHSSSYPHSDFACSNARPNTGGFQRISECPHNDERPYKTNCRADKPASPVWFAEPFDAAVTLKLLISSLVRRLQALQSTPLRPSCLIMLSV